MRHNHSHSKPKRKQGYPQDRLEVSPWAPQDLPRPRENSRYTVLGLNGGCNFETAPQTLKLSVYVLAESGLLSQKEGGSQAELSGGVSKTKGYPPNNGESNGKENRP